MTLQSQTAEQYTELLTGCHVAASFRHVWPYIEGKHVLDLGPGTGEYLALFNQGSVGVDFSIPNLRLLRQKGLRAFRADLNDTLPVRENSFDVVFCSHIIEHVDAPIHLLREANRVLKSSGFCIIAVPFEKSFVRLLLRDHYFKGHPTHLYSFSLDCFKQLLAKAGFAFRNAFVDPPGIRRFHLGLVMDILQYLPFWFTRWFAGNFWVVGEKMSKPSDGCYLRSWMSG